MPVAAVRAERRTERAELEPAHVQLAGVVRGRHEAADVGAPDTECPTDPVLIATGTCVFSVSQNE